MFKIVALVIIVALIATAAYAGNISRTTASVTGSGNTKALAKLDAMQSGYAVAKSFCFIIKKETYVQSEDKSWACTLLIEYFKKAD